VVTVFAGSLVEDSKVGAVVAESPNGCLAVTADEPKALFDPKAFVRELADVFTVSKDVAPKIGAVVVADLSNGWLALTTDKPKALFDPKAFVIEVVEVLAGSLVGDPKLKLVAAFVVASKQEFIGSSTLSCN